MHPDTIRCIALDAVGTVMTPQPSVAAIYTEVARRHGSRLTQEDIDLRFRDVFKRSERNHLDASHPEAWLTSEAQEYVRWRELVDQVIDDVVDRAACFSELFAHFARPDAWRCYDDVGPAIAAFEARGLRLILASNFDRRLRFVCAGLSELASIRTLVISSEVGWRKPSPRFFEALIAHAGCEPGQILMVGDDVENDIAGAKHAGLKTQLIRRKGDCIAGAITTLEALL